MNMRSVLMIALVLAAGLVGLKWMKQELFPGSPAVADIASAKITEMKATMTWDHFTRHSYGPHPRNILYLYRPETGQAGTGKNRPVNLTVIVHGGNYLEGAANDIALTSLARYFVERGDAVASIDYRTLTTDHWPAPVTDVADGIRKARELLKPLEIGKTTYVGFSAGAVTGAMLFYSDDYPDVPGIDRFIGISGLYSVAATPPSTTEGIRQMSRDHISILDYIRDINAPKSDIPALLIEGTEDAVDLYPGTERSHAETLKRMLEKNGGQATVFWSDREGYRNHVGPLSLMDAKDARLRAALDAFLAGPVPAGHR